MKNLQFLIILCFCSILNGQTTIASGIIGSSVWMDTVIVKGRVVLKADATLQIQPGTVVVGDTMSSLWVYGNIEALGSEEAMITFTSKDTFGHFIPESQSLYWHGIYLFSLADQLENTFIYCIFEWAKKDNIGVDSLENMSGGAISATASSKLNIDHCIFSKNVSYWEGGAVAATDTTVVRINHSLFERNVSRGSGGAFSSYRKSNVSIMHSSFVGNNSLNAGNGGAMILFNWLDTTIVAYNYIARNQGAAINAISESTNFASIHHNIIVNNGRYELILPYNFQTTSLCVCTQMSSPRYYFNNTIVNNWGQIISDNDSAYFSNNIIANHPEPRPELISATYFDSLQFHTDFLNTEINFFNNAILNDERDYKDDEQHNLRFDSVEELGFIQHSLSFGITYEDSTANWALSSNSPLIDKGTIAYMPGTPPDFDYLNQSSIAGEKIDIGAIENNYLNISNENVLENVSIYPNPLSEIVYIDAQSDINNISIIDIQGRIIKTWADRQSHTILDMSEIPSGVYFLRFKVSNSDFQTATVVIK